MSPLRDHLEKLHLFTEIARARSFNAAAQRLGRSQPALSEAMQNLEEALGLKLFSRSRQGVEPTAAGLKLLHFSERLLSEVNGVERRLRHPETSMAGTVIVGTFGSLATMLFPGFLKAMSDRYSALEVSLITLEPSELGESLISRRCHFVVGTGLLQQKSIHQRKCYADDFAGFALPKLTPAARKNILYVARARDDEGKSLSALVKTASAAPHDFGQFETVLAMAAAGLGVGILPRKLAAAAAAKAGLKPCGIPGLGATFGRHQFYCSSLRDDLDDQRTETVIAELISWASDSRLAARGA